MIPNFYSFNRYNGYAPGISIFNGLTPGSGNRFFNLIIISMILSMIDHLLGWLLEQNFKMYQNFTQEGMVTEAD